MRELFIYYRIDAAHSVSIMPLVLAAQARLRSRHAGLQTRLLRRPEAENHLQTWMETYAFAAGPSTDTHLGAAVQADIEAEMSALAPWLAGPRHVEVFITCA
jgi:hypothetical protein